VEAVDFQQLKALMALAGIFEFGVEENGVHVKRLARLALPLLEEAKAVVTSTLPLGVRFQKLADFPFGQFHDFRLPEAKR
jgi:hypothetical protein